MIEPVAWLVYEPALPTQYLTEEEPVEVLTNSPGTTATPLYAIPPGYALVPVVATQEMPIAGWNSMDIGLCPQDQQKMWEAMLTAAAKGE